MCMLMYSDCHGIACSSKFMKVVVHLLYCYFYIVSSVLITEMIENPNSSCMGIISIFIPVVLRCVQKYCIRHRFCPWSPAHMEQFTTWTCCMNQIMCYMLIIVPRRCHVLFHVWFWTGCSVTPAKRQANVYINPSISENGILFQITEFYKSCLSTLKCLKTLKSHET